MFFTFLWCGFLRRGFGPRLCSSVLLITLCTTFIRFWWTLSQKEEEVNRREKTYTNFTEKDQWPITAGSPSVYKPYGKGRSLQMTRFPSKSYPTTLAKELKGARPEKQLKLFSHKLKLKLNFNPYFEVMFNKAKQFQLQFNSRHTWLNSLLSG